MDMTEKNGQPSMEEILASIRRIIAEEPADAISLDFKPRSGLAPGNGAEQLSVDDSADFELPSMFRAGASAGTPEKTNGTSIKLMDALRNTPQLDTSVALRPQPDFPLPSNFPNTYQVASEPVREVMRPEPQPAYQALSSLRPIGRTEMPVTEIYGSGTNGSALNGSAPNGAAANGSAANGWAHEAQFVPSVEVTAVDPLADQLWAAEPAAAAAMQTFVPAEAQAPVVREMVPFKDQHFSRMFGGNSPVAEVPASAPEPAPVVEFNPIAPPRPVLTPIPETYAAPPSAHMNGTAMSSIIPGPPSLPPSFRPAEQVFGGPAPAVSAVAQPEAGGGIEDATAELLRPMLRQWLSENMPRMVEKALHIEVAESVRPGKKPGQF